MYNVQQYYHLEDMLVMLSSTPIAAPWQHTLAENLKKQVSFKVTALTTITISSSRWTVMVKKMKNVVNGCPLPLFTSNRSKERALDAGAPLDALAYVKDLSTVTVSFPL